MFTKILIKHEIDLNESGYIEIQNVPVSVTTAEIERQALHNLITYCRNTRECEDHFIVIGEQSYSEAIDKLIMKNRRFERLPECFYSISDIKHV